MKLKHNKLFLLISSIGIVGSSCFVITSCGKSDNPFQNYDVNTNISLSSRKEAKKLYDVAVTKIPNLPCPEPDTREEMQKSIRHELKLDENISKSILYWEIALNLSNIGKTHNFKKNNNLVFNVPDGNWFTRQVGDTSPWCSVTSITFDYEEGQRFNESGVIDIDFKSGDQHWSVVKDDGNSLFRPLFTSWTLFSFPTPTDII